MSAMVPRFATTLGFRGRDVLLCEAIASSVHGGGVVPGRNPLSSIAGTLHLVATLRGASSSDVNSVSRCVNVARSTTRKAYRALLLNLDTILPTNIRLQHGLSDSIIAAALFSAETTTCSTPPALPLGVEDSAQGRTFEVGQQVNPMGARSCSVN